MQDLEIQKVENKKDLMDFIQFPMRLYKGNPNYVPPLISDEKNIWDTNENPALEYSEFQLFVVKRKNEIVGRIAVIINHKESQELGVNKVRFGWLDFIDDQKVSKMLIDIAIQYAKENNIHQIEGPMGFTN
ncbi:MAG: GTP cyclohydrolase, partial [Bacteroidetes bacterium]|nr:GTP cyclohydrolase [Bacteroidota bacterium]